MTFFKQFKADAIRQLEEALELTPIGEEFRVDFGPTKIVVANTPEAIHCMIARIHAFKDTTRRAKLIRRRQGFTKFMRIHPNPFKPASPVRLRNCDTAHLEN